MKRSSSEGRHNELKTWVYQVLLLSSKQNCVGRQCDLHASCGWVSARSWRWSQEMKNSWLHLHRTLYIIPLCGYCILTLRYQVCMPYILECTNTLYHGILNTLLPRSNTLWIKHTKSKCQIIPFLDIIAPVVPHLLRPQKTALCWIFWVSKGRWQYRKSSGNFTLSGEKPKKFGKACGLNEHNHQHSTLPTAGISKY